MSKSRKTPGSPTQPDVRRRNVLKTATISGGFFASQWSTPVVKTVILPAHAATSPSPDEAIEPPQGFDEATISSFSINPSES